LLALFYAVITILIRKQDINKNENGQKDLSEKDNPKCHATKEAKLKGSKFKNWNRWKCLLSFTLCCKNRLAD